MYGSTPLTASSVAALAKVTRDRELALTALVARAIERERARVSPSDALAIERRVVARALRRRASRAYRSALARGRGEPRGRARDHGRRASLARDRRAACRRAGLVRATSRGSARPSLRCSRARSTVSPAPSWLPEGRGVALATSAPEARVPRHDRTGGRRSARPRATFVVEARDDTTALGALPADLARAAVVRELRARAARRRLRGLDDPDAEGRREQARVRARPAAGARRRRRSRRSRRSSRSTRPKRLAGRPRRDDRGLRSASRPRGDPSRRAWPG